MTTRIACIFFLLLQLSWPAPAAETAADADRPAARVASVPEIDITELIGQVARRSGKQFVIDPRVRGPVPLVGMEASRIDYLQLLAILRINQYAAYEADGLVNVIPDANARQVPMPVILAVSPKTPDDELVTLLLQAKNVCAVATVPLLRPLMPQAAHLAAMPQTNTLIIADRAGNARRIAELFERLDRLAPDKAGCSESGGK